VRVRIDVGIHPDRDRRLHAELAGDVVDAGELRLALDVEGEDPVLQGELDLALGLADAGKHARADRGPGREHAADLAAAHQIEARAEVREMAEDRDVRVGLHRVAELRIQAGEPALQPLEIILHRRGTVDVGGRAVELRNRGDVDGFAVEIGAGIVEVVHGRMGAGKFA